MTFEIRSVGIIGYGNFGAFAHVLLRRFAPSITVRSYDPKKKRDGNLFFSLHEATACDAVVLAVPISAYEATLKKISPLLGKDTVVVDVATVKSHTLKLLRKYVRGSYISTHPMFGPESYAKKSGDVSGLRIVIADHSLPRAVYSTFVVGLERIGFKVLEMSAKKHDKELAETLFLTHYIGQIISKAGFVRTDIDTVSFGYLMDAVESVRHDKALFKDVFKYDDACRLVLKKFGISEKSVRKLLS